MFSWGDFTQVNVMNYQLWYQPCHMPGAVATLLSLVDDPDSAVRRAAIHSLGRVGDSSVATAVLARAEDEDPETRAAAVAALCRLGVDEMREGVRAALVDPAEKVRVAGVAGAALLGADALLLLGRRAS